MSEGAPRGFTNKRQVPFTMLANAMLRDKALSLKAKGLLGIMLSFPDGWHYYMKHLEDQSADGREAHQNAMKELIAAGYVVRAVATDPETGKLNGWAYEVSDERLSRLTGKPSDGKPATINTEVTKTEDKKKKDGAEQHGAALSGTDTPSPSQQKLNTAKQGQSEKEAASLDTVPPAAELDIPGALSALPGFAAAWGEWLSYRRARKLSCSPVVLKGQISRLSKDADPVAMLVFSRENGYQGLFSPRSTTNGRPQTMQDANQKFIQGMADTKEAIRGVFDD